MRGGIAVNDLPPQLVGAMHAVWVALAASGDRGRLRYGLGQRAIMRSSPTCEVAGGPRTAVRTLGEAVR